MPGCSVERSVVRLGSMGAGGDAFSETGFFEADSGRFDFRREASRFESTFSFFDTGLGAIDIDVFSFFGHLGEDRDFLWRHFGKSPEDRHVLHVLADSVAEFSNFQRGEKMRMAGEHAEFAFNTRRDHFLDLLTEQQVFRRDDFK
jgi:hypothetical protein